MIQAKRGGATARSKHPLVLTKRRVGGHGYLLLPLTVCLFSPALFAQNHTPLPLDKPAGVAEGFDLRLRKLPPALRERGLTLVKESDEQKRADMAEGLAETHPTDAMDFLLAVLETDPSAKVREAIVDELGGYPHPQVRQALMRCVTTDADLGIALLALEELRSQDAKALFYLLERRLELSRRAGDEKQLRTLAREQERWISLVKGSMLPTFMQVPPPTFTLNAADRPIRVLAFGDFGDGSVAQKQVAAAMLRYHRKSPFDFAVTLGDNFYSKGMESPSDPRWKTWWDELYDPLGVCLTPTMTRVRRR
jgi:HEAT repeats